MKAIVLTYDRHHAIAQHLIWQYERLWPDHPFRFRIPFQKQRGENGARVEYLHSPPEIAPTVLRLIADLGDDEWVYWCSDDKYPVQLVVDKVKELLAYVQTASELSGLLFCRTRVTLDQPELSLLPGKTLASTGDRLLERKAWYQIWIHQFLRVKVLRYLFSELPAQVPSAKALDLLKNQVAKPEHYHLYVTEKNFAVFGESTKRGRITRNCLESISQTEIELPEWFQSSNGERIFMGRLPKRRFWHRLFRPRA